ncbi:CheR family methyltransferase [Yoonia sediminilitoris]|uniref:protein-glutamate O-methyltransferase n=1 Tax=Yoonia sediminilitoris TaxID=1286148 RepID=A0A2T6KKI8_9RHOB|nr:CheR family methyltransferase [Yoonia sediminilitoris]PUB16442.1 chemotaxis protein methyltransferase CheR [Yoonia sediminilitoris]RCW96791.1 chemotaxis protein methyltransferase CheR [Yoonia sediminilitoris]
MGFYQVADLNAAQCQFLTDTALKASGVNVDPDKRDFLHLRISRRLKALGLDSFDDYIGILKREPGGPETRHLVEALTTHTTSFFREGHQYEWFEQEGIKRLLTSQPESAGKLTVWSAACSTGVELWSAGMVLMDRQRQAFDLRDFALIGTDISQKILKTAHSATYSTNEITGVSPLRKQRYLMQSKRTFGASDQHYHRVIPELRQKARFEQINLSALGSARPFTVDVAFLRNVLIYFGEEMQKQVLDGVISRLRPGGILFTGHSEAVPKRDDLDTLGPSIYEKV